MGYYTRFKLIVEDTSKQKPHEYKQYKEPSKIERFAEYMESTTDYPFNMMDSWSDNVYHSGDTWKWYEHDDDMRTLSKKFPDLIFTLDGEGEESGDIWRSYYKNGKMINYQANIVFPAFNEKDLR